MRVIICLLGLLIFVNAAQKLADEPKDRPIQVRDHSSDKVYCYDPSFSKGEGYYLLCKEYLGFVEFVYYKA